MSEGDTPPLLEGPTVDSMDLDAIAADLRTLAALVERNVGQGDPLPDDVSTHLADLAEQVEMWHEAVSE